MISISDQIIRRIRIKGRGFTFTAKDFLDLGKRGAVDVALSFLADSHQIRRVDRGLYDYPRYSELLGEVLAPDFDQVAHAIARKTGIRILPAGAVAANLLGLSDQVPAQIIYLTDGRTRIIEVGGQTITFQKVSPKEILPDGKASLVIQALRFLGKDSIDDKVILKVRQILSPTERKRLLKAARYTATWMPEVVKRIAGEPQDG